MAELGVAKISSDEELKIVVLEQHQPLPLKDKSNSAPLLAQNDNNVNESIQTNIVTQLEEENTKLKAIIQTLKKERDK